MDPSKMKVVDLRSELGALGLDTKGNKPALVERLRKALEAKTGKVLAETTILDTSTEDGDEPPTPRRPGPAPRTTRRSSSSRLAGTPLKKSQEEPPEAIQEEAHSDGNDRYSPGLDSEPERSPDKEDPKESDERPQDQDIEKEDESSSAKEDNVLADEAMDSQESGDGDGNKEPESKGDEGKKEDGGDGDKPENMEVDDPFKNPKRELTEEEEWEELNEKLKIKEQERLEREKKQAEADAKKLEELSSNPVKLQRYKRKLDKKARWSNYYRNIETTNEILTPPVPDPKFNKNKKEAVIEEPKIPEPEIDDSKITLSWYDSDLNQYLEVPGLNGVVPLSEGAFSHAWAGARGTHGVTSGRVVYEVRVGSVVTTTETVEKEPIASGLRVGWSTEDSPLHLGEGEFSWGYESTGRAVNNSEFKEYGKQLNERDVIGIYLDLESSPCKISYTLNGVELGVAYEFEKTALDGKALFPHVLTKNLCYKVNFGYDRYNMLTKTKIVRKRMEIPVEEVLEEKRRIEEELKRQKEEAIQKEKERREKERKEREERQRKRKEEREKQERERKERELQEKKDRGEDVEMESEDLKKEDEKDKENEKDKVKEEDKEKDSGEAVAVKEDKEEPKENGEKSDDKKPAEEQKPESMETENADGNTAEVKTETEDANKEGVSEVTEEEVLKGRVLDSRIKFVIRFSVDEELDGNDEACLLPGFVLMSEANLVAGPRCPPTKADCEVILMVGMPGSGKTYWARQHCEQHPEKRYNILSTGALFDRMKVDCKPFRTTYEGRWDAMVSKGAKCVLKLLEIARGRRRNFILDQTNVYPSAQRRKLKEFDGYRRVAVVIVTDEETYRDRHKRREQADGKEVPDGAVLDMKANFALPERCTWLDEVIYPELGEEKAKEIVEGLHKEARAAGVGKERDRDRRDRESPRDQPPSKRPRPRDRERDRSDERWGGGGGGSRGGRWGPPVGGPPPRGGGGGRWGGGGGRDRPPPPPRFDRNWGPPQPGRGDFGGGRDRDGFRGGRSGSSGPGGPGGPRGDRGPMPPSDRFQRDRPPRPHDNKRPPPGPNSGTGGSSSGTGGGNATQSGGSSGSWQRGGQVANSRGAAPPASRSNNSSSSRPTPPSQNKDSSGNSSNQNQVQNQQNQQGWNQWTGGWGGWGNWNQNQGWGNWGNWNNWGNPSAGGQGGQTGSGQAGGKGQAATGQWPANYTAQQWYQWQQWQQQQQGWPGYQQGNAQGGAQDAQAWGQYYQMMNSGGGGNTNTTEKK